MNKGIFKRLTRPLLQRRSLLSIANVIKHRHAFGLVNNHGATNDDETDGIAAAACGHPSTNANAQQGRTENLTALSVRWRRRPLHFQKISGLSSSASIV
jgi:hypothetical protein